ncbi:hypothetical protein [Sulfurimonas sp.]
MKSFLLLLLITLNAVASGEYSLRATTGVATDYDFGEILTGKIGEFQANSEVYSLDAGYLVRKASKNIPIDFYLKSGLSYFEQPSFASPVYETTIYLKAYYNIDFFDNRVRVGFGEGASYTSAILQVEKDDAEVYGDNNSHYLNYIDMSLDLDFGRLVKYKPLEELYLGVLIKHRSGIFGLINNVRHGGSNHVCVYIEKNF